MNIATLVYPYRDVKTAWLWLIHSIPWGWNLGSGGKIPDRNMS
jgi:hypothetical protein